ncbi:nucleolar protein dao-5 [Biomphalaria pfeifferi]|uniref:Nucleolar protein dao-5 n=1 Tax=Biomphalaria pfeifferi TaxID=112525 RepID=A0AAD8FFT7_BIOPF|nr:nucleolar protein dao-5 [Biomphalaria pfeifferi]
MMNKLRCEALCQHPHCWFVHDQHGVDVQTKSHSSNRTIETDLPTQSIQNLLADYGIHECSSNLHDSVSNNMIWKLSLRTFKQETPIKSRYNSTNPNLEEYGQSYFPFTNRMNHLKTFDTDFLNIDRTSKQYIWVSNSNEKLQKKNQLSSLKDNSHTSLNTADKSVTKLFLPLEEIHAKQGSPVKHIKKVRKFNLLPNTAQKPKSSSKNNIDQKVLSRNKSTVSVENTAGHGHLLLQINPKDTTNVSIETLNSNQGNLALLENQREITLPSVNSLVPVLPLESNLQLSNKNSKFAFIYCAFTKYRQLTVLQPSTKISSISLGLPELPSGVKITKPFSYKKKDLNFTLGPVLSALSTLRSDESTSNREDKVNFLQKDFTIQEVGQCTAQSPVRSVSVYLPDPSVKSYILPQKITSPDKKECNEHASNKQMHETFDNKRTLTTMETISIYSNPNSAISPDKIFESDTENLLMTTVRPSSVATNSTGAWPSVTEAVVERTVALASSKSQFQSSRKLEEHKSKVQSAEILKMAKSKGQSPAPPPPSPELRKHTALALQNASQLNEVTIDTLEENDARTLA